nr:reverse transcriptase domain-containing protein [Tanacetum cinerariifolium]
MRTRSSSNLVGESSPNPTTSNLKHRNRRLSKQPFILEESPVDTMADQRTMVKLLRAPTEGYAEAIVVPPILVEHFELKHSLINIMTLDQFFGLEKYNHHDHIRGNLLEKRTQDVLTIIENKSKIAKLTHAVNEQTSVVTTAMTAILKQFQATSPPASVKSVKKICVTCGGAHPYYQCLAADGNTFLKFRDNIHGYISATVVNYNQGKLKSITTRSGLVLDGPSVPMPPPFINPEEDERTQETLTDPDLAEYTIKVPPPLVQKAKPPSQRNYVFRKKLGLPELISTHMTLELANRAICTSAGIARDVFVSVGKFTFPTDFVIVDYESDPRVLLILGIPFLWTAHALIDVHEEEMILRDIRLSSSPDHLLEEFSDELALIIFPSGNDDLPFDIESDLREIEYLLNHDPTKEIDSISEDSVDEDVDDDLVELESDNDDVYDDPFDSKGDKIKESKLLINELDPPRLSDFFPSPECDSILYKNFSEVDALPS